MSQNLQFLTASKNDTIQLKLKQLKQSDMGKKMESEWNGIKVPLPS